MEAQVSHLFHLIALNIIPGLGPIHVKNLLAVCGSAEQVFKEKKSILTRIPYLPKKALSAISTFSDFHKVDHIIQHASLHGIQILDKSHSDYPPRLLDLIDAPHIIYTKGVTPLHAAKAIAIVGTRKATGYGIDLSHQLIHDLKPYAPIIVSGLALGIDTAAHAGAILQGLPTIAVLPTGLDTIYPRSNQKMALQILEQGAWVSEFPVGTQALRDNFPARNRIIAGLVDAVVVAESGIKGGAIMTANLAFDYNREVLCFPGRVYDTYSSGCLQLVVDQKASLIRGAADVASALGWQPASSSDLASSSQQPRNVSHSTVPAQAITFLPEDQQQIVDILVKHDKLDIDAIAQLFPGSSSQLANTLLQMELEGMVKPLPGKAFRLIR